MAYWIMVFNQQPLGKFTGESLLAALRSAHFETLCAQYGLDPALIAPALDHLSVEKSARGQAPFFCCAINPNGSRPSW